MYIYFQFILFDNDTTGWASTQHPLFQTFLLFKCVNFILWPTFNCWDWAVVGIPKWGQNLVLLRTNLISEANVHLQCLPWYFISEGFCFKKNSNLVPLILSLKICVTGFITSLNETFYKCGKKVQPRSTVTYFQHIYECHTWTLFSIKDSSGIILYHRVTGCHFTHDFWNWPAVLVPGNNRSCMWHTLPFTLRGLKALNESGRPERS